MASSDNERSGASEAHYRALFQHSRHCVHELDLAGRIRAMNPVGLTWAGAENADSVVNTEFLDLVADSDHGAFEDALGKAVEGEVVEFEYQGQDGGAYASCLVPITEDGSVTHLLGLTQNLTEFQQTERALTDLRSRHSLILESAGEGVYGLDADGCLTFGNKAAEQILGWHTDKIRTRKAHDVHHHSHADGTHYPREECPIYAALKDGQIHHVEDEVFWHADGSAVPVEYTSTPILKNGKPDGAVVVFRDVTQRRKMEAQQAATFREIKQLKEQLEQERDYLRDEVNLTSQFGEIIGESQALRRTLAQLEAVAPTPANVIILGESGVGKELIARALHARSDRANKPLVKVNCASVPKELFESEFFGHVKGAFTGAHRDRVGRLQLADGGTLFLDEVGEIPLSEQSKLLRALQEHEFERVGDQDTTKVDVRVVAATNRDLAAEVKAGRFREDLYYRLSVFPIEVPPLRDRLDDVGPLACHFLDLIGRELGRESLRLTEQQLARLKRHSWPGNIRELKNVMERAAISSTGSRLRVDMALPDPVPPTPSHTTPARDDSTFVSDAEFRALEKDNLVAALRSADGRIWGEGGAADLLGLNPSTLKYRMKQLKIDRHAIRRD